jgi:7,8-dihydropterin-6-yl-methyl-4-(beta-D-ribofuranosyl)aminobenzene 5'-phosphate synthase
MKSAAQGDFYTKKLFSYESTGIDPAVFAKYADRIAFIDDDTEVTNGVTAASVNKYRHLPLYASVMYEKRDEKLLRDDLSHELFIAVKAPDGIIVITGCSHHGLINILMSAQEKFGEVAGVIGGFHLNGVKQFLVRTKKEPAAEIRTIAKYLRDNKIKKIYTGHCTGEKPCEKLELLVRAKKIHSGDIIDI